MTEVGKFCCFICPKPDFNEYRLSDICPSCGNPYGFMLENPPTRIGDYRVRKALGRGFYGATYVVEQKTALRTSLNVLKVIPKAVYSHFKKDFRVECENHAQAAENAKYIVGIEDMFDSEILFGGIKLDCHVAVLEHLDGTLLQSYFSSKNDELSSASAAQIASDLFRIQEELAERRQNHNDLHAGNIIIEKRGDFNFRTGEIDGSIRAVAIDLGSLADDRRSDGGKYLGDLHWVGDHVKRLADALAAKEPSISDDTDTRVAMALRVVSNRVSISTEAQRTPTSEDISAEIRGAFYRTSEPWRPWADRFQLSSFRDSYNAQTLYPWNVPQLLVDPEGEWQRSVCTPGPMIITGMRGCGKTMLLRALQFHARAARIERETTDDILRRLRNDRYVGLYVSASSLLDFEEDQALEKENLFARLAIAYTLDAARSLVHLQDVDPGSVDQHAHQTLSSTLFGVLQNASPIDGSHTIQELQSALERALLQACQTYSSIRLGLHPSGAFPALADAIRRCSPVWQSSQVLFLLDEVTTRYLQPGRIDELLSALLFQHADCSFKMTSETQTIFLSLNSPGGINPASRGRDFDTFDLGAEVHKRLKQKNGNQFVQEILAQRAKVTSHPNRLPRDILGDKSLADIAKEITTSDPTSRKRKEIYQGISALKAVCVGDIGSVITIYSNILKGMRGKPVASPAVQNEAFQDFCSHSLYVLDRRDSKLKDVAKSFAAASYELMMQSSKKKERRGLRQYSSLYVRVTAGDVREQSDKLRELVDAGIFVFQSGGAPRTKTRDSDPVQQFKLTFRKVFGLADYMGLSERDRFELSGEALREWLENPSNGKELLMRNLRTGEKDSDSEIDDYEDGVTRVDVEEAIKPAQTSLALEHVDQIEAPAEENAGQRVSPIELPEISPIEGTELRSRAIETLVLALGFEERALESAKRAIEEIKPQKVLAVQYEEIGKSDAILDYLTAQSVPYAVVKYSEFLSEPMRDGEGLRCIDVTGLTKAGIHHAIRSSYLANRELCIIYTEAQQYYPLEDNLKSIVRPDPGRDVHSRIDALKDVLSGENSPYFIDSLSKIPTDGTRMKALLAFGTAKHERLIHLVTNCNYDVIRVLVDNRDSNRALVAKIASEVAVKAVNEGTVVECDIRDPKAVLLEIESFFLDTYVNDQMNFDIGLTGDKVEAISASIFSSLVKVNNVLYVRPSSFDPQRFTQGTGETHYFMVRSNAQ